MKAKHTFRLKHIISVVAILGCIFVVSQSHAQLSAGNGTNITNNQINLGGTLTQNTTLTHIGNGNRTASLTFSKDVTGVSSAFMGGVLNVARIGDDPTTERDNILSVQNNTVPIVNGAQVNGGGVGKPSIAGMRRYFILDNNNPSIALNGGVSSSIAITAIGSPAGGTLTGNGKLIGYDVDFDPFSGITPSQLANPINVNVPYISYNSGGIRAYQGYSVNGTNTFSSIIGFNAGSPFSSYGAQGFFTYQNAYGIYIQPQYMAGYTTGTGYGIYQQGANDINVFNGSVGIGTATPKEALSVNGNIRAKDIKVDANNWPDYVFTPEHQLPSLEALFIQIKEQGHLPNIPSAEEVSKNGIALGEINKKLLEKVEELTLYVIKQNEQIKDLKTQSKDVKQLKELLLKQNEKIAQLEKLISHQDIKATK